VLRFYVLSVLVVLGALPVLAAVIGDAGWWAPTPAGAAPDSWALDWAQADPDRFVT